MDQAVTVNHIDTIVSQVSVTIEAMNKKQISVAQASSTQRLLNTVVSGKRDQLRHNIHTNNTQPIDFYKS
jgi:hypothetical protein